jgi:hypothetical protein
MLFVYGGLTIAYRGSIFFQNLARSRLDLGGRQDGHGLGISTHPPARLGHAEPAKATLRLVSADDVAVFGCHSPDRHFLPWRVFGKESDVSHANEAYGNVIYETVVQAFK